MQLSLPALWEAVKVKELQAALREREQRRTIMLGSFEVPEHSTNKNCNNCNKNKNMRFVPNGGPISGMQQPLETTPCT